MKSLPLLVLLAAASVCAQTSAPAPAKPKAGTAGVKPSPAPKAAKPAASTPSTPATTATPKVAGDERPGVPATPDATPSDDNKIVLTVGPDKISAKEFETFIEALPEQYRQQARGPMKRQVAEQIARVKLLADEARKRGLDKDKAVQARIAFQADNLLAGAAFNDMLAKTTVGDTDVRKYYDEHKNEYEEVQARHVLIRFKGSPVPLKKDQKDLTEEEALAKAQEVRKRVTGGEDFAKVAKETSDDTTSGAAGGDLGTFKRGSMVPLFENAAFTMAVGQVSEPIKTQFGYHVIKVDKHDVKAFDTVKGEIEGRVRPDVARKAVDDLRAKANITLDEAYFGPAEPAAPAPGTPVVAPAAQAPAAAPAK